MDDRGEPSSDLTATTMKSLALVLTNYTFSCNGFLDQWNIYWELENVERCEIVMDFHILRPTKTADFCGLVSVASTQVVLTPPDHPGRQTVISSFSVSDSVRVETGDLVGLVVMFSDSERCPPAARVSVLETSNPSDPDLVYLAIQASQEDDLELGSIAGFGCDDSSSDASDKTRSSTTTRGRDGKPDLLELILHLSPISLSSRYSNIIGQTYPKNWYFKTCYPKTRYSKTSYPKINSNTSYPKTRYSKTSESRYLKSEYSRT